MSRKRNPSIAPKGQTELGKDPCPCCQRPNFFPSDHHLVPRSRGGKETETICEDCHRAVHALFDNKTLARELCSVDALMAHDAFRKMVDYLKKQAPDRRQTFCESNSRKRRR